MIIDWNTVDWNLVTNVIVGLGSSILVAFVSPLVKWGVDWRRMRTENRQEHIRRWRRELQNYAVINPSYFGSSTYTAIRNQLRPSAVEKLESEDLTPTSRKRALLDEIAWLEQDKWRLL